MIEQVAPAPEPPWLAIARGELGVREVSGAPNERVNEYLRAVGGKPGQDWCSGFAEWVFEQIGIAGPGSPAARSWQHWHEEIEEPRLGCVCVLWRVSLEDWRGHVAFLVSASPKSLLLLGGNQLGSVSIRRYPRARVLSFRWPQW